MGFALYFKDNFTSNTIFETHLSSDLGREHSNLFWIYVKKAEIILHFPSYIAHFSCCKSYNFLFILKIYQISPDMCLSLCIIYFSWHNLCLSVYIYFFLSEKFYLIIVWIFFPVLFFFRITMDKLDHFCLPFTSFSLESFCNHCYFPFHFL